jgi:hypothetical protein
LVTAHARTTNHDTAADDLRNLITDLTRTRNHREHLTATIGHTTVGHAHFTKVPPLLAQLQYANPASETGSRSGAGFESRPAASLEALDTLVRIDLEAARWVRDLGEDDPATTLRCVALVGALLPSTNRCKRPRPAVDQQTRKVTCCTWHAIEHDVRRWWTQARIVTGWDAPAWRPDNTCPSCGVRRALRIRLAERVGFCTECHETWSPAGEPGYQLLAEHIRVESELEATRVRLRSGPCLCAWPRRTPPGLAALCPRCGSATCRHAVRVAGGQAS